MFHTTCSETNVKRKFRIEIHEPGSLLWKCVWLAELNNSKCSLLKAKIEISSFDLCKSSTGKIQSVTYTYDIYSNITNMSCDVMGSLWNVLDENNVWHLNPRSPFAYDGITYFVSVYEKGRTHQFSTYCPDNVKFLRIVSYVENYIYR